MYTLYYTNLGFDISDFIKLGNIIRVVIGDHINIYISDKWFYSKHFKGAIDSVGFKVLSDDRLIEISDFTNSVFFNFSYESLNKYLNVIRYAVISYVSRENFEIISMANIHDAVKMIDFDLRRPLSPDFNLNKHIQSYKLILHASKRVEPSYIQVSVKMMNYRDIASFSPFNKSRSLSIFIYKRAIQQAIKLQKKIIYMSTTLGLNSILADIEDEDRIVRDIFHRNQMASSYATNHTFYTLPKKADVIRIAPWDYLEWEIIMKRIYSYRAWPSSPVLQSKLGLIRGSFISSNKYSNFSVNFRGIDNPYDIYM